MISAADRTALSPRQSSAPVTLINCFEVPAGREAEFFDAWKGMNTYFRAQPGYVSNRLHRAVSPSARYAFVNVVAWESAEAYQAAHTTEFFQSSIRDPKWRDFPNVPGLFEVVFEADVDSGVTFETQ